jgi:hypothetical protein
VSCLMPRKPPALARAHAHPDSPASTGVSSHLPCPASTLHCQ